jgi:predicted nucleotidyltransferase
MSNEKRKRNKQMIAGQAVALLMTTAFEDTTKQWGSKVLIFHQLCGHRFQYYLH